MATAQLARGGVSVLASRALHPYPRIQRVAALSARLAGPAARVLAPPVAALALAFATAGCGARQVCECAVYVGGTTPAGADEEQERGSRVDACLKQHGGGTITGCPMPPSMPPMSPRRLDVAAGGAEDEPASRGDLTPTSRRDVAPVARAASCPPRAPANASSCALGAGRCAYADQACVCIDECAGGAKIAEGHVPPPARWQCSPRPLAVRADGCPGEPPGAGTPCTTARTCSYGLAETGVCWGFTLACANARWTSVLQAPPP